MIEHGYGDDTFIIDFGCGTGLVAQHLTDKQPDVTLNIIGIDASDGMLEKAKPKELYQSLHKQLLCKPEEFKTSNPDWLAKFDYVTASGLLAEGHATNDIFTEMDLVLKQGGYAIFTSREEYLTSLKY